MNISFAASNTILVMGDSLSAAYGIPVEKGWVTLLEEKLNAEKFPHRIVNASISGETTDGGIARLPQLLKRTQPKIMILELGANDGLRGQPLANMESNLRKMITMAKKQKAEVIVVGMRLPPNFGLAYTSAFFATFRKVAETEKTAYVPFLFEGFASERNYFLPDTVHPNETAQPLILKTVWPVLEKFLRP